jgi:hypothetical protein
VKTVNISFNGIVNNLRTEIKVCSDVFTCSYECIGIRVCGRGILIARPLISNKRGKRELAKWCVEKSSPIGLIFVH